MNGAAPDVLIVGGGIVGAACAWECSLGGLKVMVVEADVPGSGATAAGMGHIVAMEDSTPEFHLTRYSQIIWNELVHEMPAGVEYLPCGTLWVAVDEEEMAGARRKQASYLGRGVPAELLDARQLAEAEPSLRSGLVGGLLVPEDSALYPPVAAQWLLTQSGAEVRRGRVVSISDSGAQLEDGTLLTAGIIVNAAGAMSSKLMPGVPVTPRKGHLVITERYPGFLRHQVVELGYLKSAHAAGGDSVALNVQPRATGQVLIGSSRQHGATHKEIDRPILSAMLRRAEEYLPGIMDLVAVRCWTGFRATTPDKLPLIGPWPGTQRVWLATGHEGLGITTGPATGRLVADLILGRTPAIPAQPYLPARCGHA